MITIWIAVIGMLALVVLAAIIGMADGRARRQAWDRIARRRRELGEWERELIRAAEVHDCPVCRLRPEHTELHDRF
jgi:hypothetical protein